MRYIIMLIIVIGLAISDFITGAIKAYCTEGLVSSKMRRGGLNKLGEVVVMLTACGLDLGIKALGTYYQAAELSAIAGKITAVAVFGYIVIMEIISILENYAEINPRASWVLKVLKSIKKENDDDNNNQ